MKKLLSFLFLLIPFIGFSQTYQTVQSGNWNDPCTWSTTCDPASVPPTDASQNNFTIIINEGHEVRLDGDFLFKNNLTLIIYGSLIVEKDMGEVADLTGNGLILRIHCGASLKVNGALRLQNIGDLMINGTFIVEGIYGHSVNSGNCIYTTEPECNGTIVTNDGGEPPVENFNYGGEGKCDEGIAPILPIELIDFSLIAEQDHILIKWISGSEINNDYFTVLKSSNLDIWKIVGHIDGVGNSSTPVKYELIDYNPIPGISYYKLRQTDFDGMINEFAPLGTNWESNDIKIYNYGNTLVLKAPNYINWNLIIIDVNGKSLYKGRVYNDSITFNFNGNIFFFTFFNNNEKINIIYTKPN